MKAFFTSLILCLATALPAVSAQAARLCDLHPMGEGCPRFCEVFKLEPSCGGNAGENFCKLKPFEKGCPNFCRVHQIDPACR